LDGRPAGWLPEPSRAALAQVPDAEQWARGFSRDLPITAKAFRRRAAPFTVHTAADGIAHACIPQPDGMLHDLLVGAIGECAAWTAPGARRGIPTAAVTSTAAVTRERGEVSAPRNGAGLTQA